MVRILVGAMLFCFAFASSFGDDSSGKAPNDKAVAKPAATESAQFLDNIAGNWEANDLTLLGFFEKYGSFYKFLFSFEDNAPMDSSIEKRRIALTMKNATLRQVLAKIQADNPDLLWEVNNDVLNIMRGNLTKDKNWELNYIAPKVDIASNPEMLANAFRKDDILLDINPMVMFDPQSIDPRTQKFRSPVLSLKERSKSVRALLNIYINAYRDAGFISYWSFVQSNNGKYRLSVMKIGELRHPFVKANKQDVPAN